MKKTTIALAIALASVATAAQAAPNDNTWYSGAKLGWSNYHDIKFSDPLSDAKGKHNQLGAGAYLGYQANPYVGFELGYDWLGRMAYDEINSAYKAQGIQLTAKLSYPVTNELDIYTRLGGMTWRADTKTPGKRHNTGVSPVFAGGLEYALASNVATRLEYQWVNNIGDASEIGNRPDNGMLSVGVAYRFGQGQVAAVVPAVAAIAVPAVETKRFALKSDVAFNFGKETLKPEGKHALDQMFGQLKNINPTSGGIIVMGHTDRIGSAAFNQQLSEKRAQSVVNYLVSKGLPSDRISARGMGKSDPVTGSTCNTVKPRKALIDCLSPDRRVDIEVKGTLEVLNETAKAVSTRF